MATCGTCNGTGRVRGQRKFSCHCGGYRSGCSTCGDLGSYYAEDSVPCTNLLCGGGTVPDYPSFKSLEAPTSTPSPSGSGELLPIPHSIGCVLVGLLAIHIGNGMYAQHHEWAWEVYYLGWAVLLVGAVYLAVRAVVVFAYGAIAAWGLEWLAPDNPVSPLVWQGLSWCWLHLRNWAALVW